jgi:hypothetical protein
LVDKLAFQIAEIRVSPQEGFNGITITEIGGVPNDRAVIEKN